MINFVYSSSLAKMGSLAHAMFFDRAKQFSDRLGWDVSVAKNGEERDDYDALSPLYVIVSDEIGRHQGSMRFLPTTGRTMVNEHFAHLTNGVKVASPFIWEYSKVCISDHADKRTSARLVAAGAKLMQEFAIEQFVGVLDRRMEAVYRHLVTSQTIVERIGTDRSVLIVGLREFCTSSYLDLLRKSELSEVEMECFLANSDIGNAIQETDTLLDSIMA